MLRAHPLVLLEATSKIPAQVPVPRRVLLSADLQSARCLVFLLPLCAADRLPLPAGAGSQLEGCASPLRCLDDLKAGRIMSCTLEPQHC